LIKKIKKGGRKNSKTGVKLRKPRVHMLQRDFGNGPEKDANVVGVKKGLVGERRTGPILLGVSARKGQDVKRPATLGARKFQPCERKWAYYIKTGDEAAEKGKIIPMGYRMGESGVKRYVSQQARPGGKKRDRSERMRKI